MGHEAFKVAEVRSTGSSAEGCAPHGVETGKTHLTAFGEDPKAGLRLLKKAALNSFELRTSVNLGPQRPRLCGRKPT